MPPLCQNSLIIKNANSWVNEAQHHEKNQAWDEALHAYQQALTLDPENAHIHNSIGTVYQHLGQPDQAEEHCQAAIRLDHKLAPPHYNLGLLYKTQGRAKEAQAELERFLELTHDQEEVAQAKTLLTELSGLTYEKCTECGRISTLGHFFKSARQRKICPRCQVKPRLGVSTFFWLGVAILIILGSLAISYYTLVNALLAIILIFPLIIVHELCHIAAAWLAKGKLFEIHIGTGPIVWEKHLGSLLLSLGKYPTIVSCIAAFPTRSLVRLRLFLFCSAGILFHVLMLLLFAPSLVTYPYRFIPTLAPVFVLMPPSLCRIYPGFGFHHFASTFTSTYAFREAFIIANAIMLLSTLPGRLDSRGFETGSDGFQLWQILSGKVTEDAAHLAYFITEAAYALKRGAYASAIEASEAGLAVYPNNTMLENTQAVAMLELGRHAEALALFKELLVRSQAQPPVEEPGITDADRPLLRALYLNNVAYATLLTSPVPGELKQAYEYAREAFRMMPWFTPLQGTWGAVLVEIGRLEEGLEHLLEAYEYGEDASSKAKNLAHTAIGYQRLGNREKAAELLQKAIALDESDYVVQKAQEELQRT